MKEEIEQLKREIKQLQIDARKRWWKRWQKPLVVVTVVAIVVVALNLVIISSSSNQTEYRSGFDIINEYKPDTDTQTKDTDGDGVIDSLDDHPLSATLITKSYSWSYKGVPYSFSIQISEDLYHYINERNGDRGSYYIQSTLKRVTESYDNSTVQIVANKLSLLMDSDWDYYTKAEFVLRFVQNSISYDNIEDNGVSPNYFREPIETLFEKQGDCDCTSILLASLYRQLGFDCCLVSVFAHMFIGVKIDQSFLCSSFQLGWDYYAACETTSVDRPLGNVVKEYTIEDYELVDALNPLVPSIYVGY